MSRYTHLFVLMWRPEVIFELLPLLAFHLETQGLFGWTGWPGGIFLFLLVPGLQMLIATLDFTQGAGI